MEIIAIHKETGKVVRVTDTFECGGVSLACVESLEGKPFVGGSPWPIRTEFATVKAAELEFLCESGRTLAELAALVALYRKALDGGRLEAGRVKKAFVLALGCRQRPYITTLAGCNCPDAGRGNYCKHRIAALMTARMSETIQGVRA